MYPVRCVLFPLLECHLALRNNSCVIPTDDHRWQLLPHLYDPGADSSEVDRSHTSSFDGGILPLNHPLHPTMLQTVLERLVDSDI